MRNSALGLDAFSLQIVLEAHSKELSGVVIPKDLDHFSSAPLKISLDLLEKLQERNR
jgi:hypothetical protein